MRREKKTQPSGSEKYKTTPISRVKDDTCENEDPPADTPTNYARKTRIFAIWCDIIYEEIVG